MYEQSVSSLPLKGQRILNTRTQGQAGTFSSQLRALGAIPIEFPTIQIVAPDDWEPLDNALKRLCEADCYDWVVFTSANGVQIFFERLLELGYQVESIHKVHIAAIGPATAMTLAKYEAKVDLVPATFIAESVATALIEDVRKQGESLQGKKVLLARAAEARNVLIHELQSVGVEVDVVATYRTIGIDRKGERGQIILRQLEDVRKRGESLQGKKVLLARAAEARNVLIHELQSVGVEVDVVATYRTIGIDRNGERGQIILRQLEDEDLDVITFTSSSTVRNFMQWLIEHDAKFAETFIRRVAEFARPKIACIGPITSQTARECGLQVHIEAQVYTIAGLIEAIIRNEGRE